MQYLQLFMLKGTVKTDMSIVGAHYCTLSVMAGRWYIDVIKITLWLYLNISLNLVILVPETDKTHTFL